jgi:site-specific recombinase XerD
MENLNDLINHWFDYLKVERQLSRLTIRNYKHYTDRFLTWINGSKQNVAKAEDIDQKLVRQYRVWLAEYQDDKGESLKPVTQGYHVIALRSFLRWCVKNNYQVIAPDKIDLPKTDSRRLEFLNSEQVERLLNMPSISAPHGLRDKAILELLYSTGLRVSELAKLNRDQIDLKRREFGVKGKGGRVRVVFLSQRAVDWLDRYLVTRDDQWEPLFINYRHTQKKPEIPTGGGSSLKMTHQQIHKFDTAFGETKRLTPRSIQRLVKKYAGRAKLPIEITPHGIRHSFATDLLRAGADLRSVQELLGHKNISTTQIYTHVTDRQLKEVYEKYHGKSE